MPTTMQVRSVSAPFSDHEGPRTTRDARIAVLIPCYNEAAAIGNVVRSFQEALPTACVYVYDNCSTDQTAAQAAAAGAVVRSEPMRGKGSVVRRMFADIDADVYVLVDGDGEHEASVSKKLVARLLGENLDMVVGVRGGGAYRKGHKWGNRLMTTLVARLFGKRCTDLLSGYRVLSRRFVKSFPALSRGFETEAELTIHALTLGLPMAEVPTAYGSRVEGTQSKLSTFSDGGKILFTILNLFKNERPLPFFAAVALLLACVSLALALPLLPTYLDTGRVPRMPTALLSTGIMLVAFVTGACGLILDTVTLGRLEMRRLAYLQQPRLVETTADDVWMS